MAQVSYENVMTKLCRVRCARVRRNGQSCPERRSTDTSCVKSNIATRERKNGPKEPAGSRVPRGRSERSAHVDDAVARFVDRTTSESFVPRLLEDSVVIETIARLLG